MDTIQTREPGLAEFLRDRARHSTDTRLAADAAGGFIVAAVTLAWPYPFWYLVVEAALCFFAFGVWGIADRELQERGAAASNRMRRVLLGARWIATVLGAVSATVLALSLMGLAIGRVIS